MWERLQTVEHDSYEKSPVGVFSVDGCTEALEVGNFLRDNVKGECLDVGCGLLPEPSYMKDQPDITFTGIDPFGDEVIRKFHFVQGVGECIPFKNEHYDCVLFASTIDHMIDPQLAIKEAYRVLKTGGSLVIWYTERSKPHLIFGKYNRHHQWGFTNEVLVDFVRKAQFENTIISVVLKTGHNERIIQVRK